MPGRRALAVLAPLPLAIPSYVAAFAWVAAVPWARGFVGAALVLTACTYPYVYLPVVAAMRSVDPAQEEVSRSLGRSALRTFWTVTARQVWPSAASGGLLVALYTLSDFGAVSILQFDVFTRVIHTSYRASFDRTPAAVLSLLLVVVHGVHRAGGAAQPPRLEQTRVGSGVLVRSEPLPRARGGERCHDGGGRGARRRACLPRSPHSSTGSSPGSPPASTSSACSAAPARRSCSRCSARSVTMALAVPIGVLVARHRSRSSGVIETATWAGHALPGIVVALALVFFGVRVARPIYQQTPLLLIAYAVLFLPAGVVPCVAPSR